MFLQNLLLQLDAPTSMRYYIFQDSATPQMEGIDRITW